MDLKKLMFLKAATGGSEVFVEKTATGNPATFTTAVTKALKGLTVTVDSETGVTAVNVYSAGKNLFKTTASSKDASGLIYTVNADGTITISGVATGYSDMNLGECVLPPSGEVIVSGVNDMTNICWESVKILDGSKTVLQSLGSGAKSNQSFNIADYPTAKYVRLTVKRQNNVETSGTIKPQVEIAEIVSDYAQYAGSTNAITFGETVNAGTLDVLTGVLEVTQPASKTIHVDPVSIQTLNGTNHIWSDAGGTNTVKYYDKQ